jgi:hypothetical protein
LKYKNAFLWSLFGLLLLAVCLVAVFRVWPVLFPKANVTLPIDPTCDLRSGTCTTTIDETSSVSFAIEPREIPVMKPLQLRVSLRQLAAQRVEVHFNGVDMNMGFNRVQLSKAGENLFEGKGVLPVCVRDAMEWQADVLITTDKGLISVPYRFITVRSGMPVTDNQ